MDKKHYKKYLKELINAGITKKTIAEKCRISTFTIDTILNWGEVTERIKSNIAEWYDNIVSKLLSIK